MKEQKPILTPLFKDKTYVPLQPLSEIELAYTISPLVAIQVHLPYDAVDTLLILDTDLPIGNLAFIRGIPLLQSDVPYRVILHKDRVQSTPYYFKQRGYIFGHKNIIDIRDEEGDPLIPDITVQFIHSNYKMVLNRSPFTVKLIDDEDEEEEGGLAYKGQQITMDALECSFNIVGNLLVDHDALPFSDTLRG